MKSTMLSKIVLGSFVLCAIVLALTNASTQERIISTSNNDSLMKWCSSDPTGQDNDDLGSYRNLDKCCRDHYKCESIEPTETIHEITNNSSNRLYHCDCEDKFYECLKTMNPDSIFEKALTNSIAWKYFNYDNPECFNKTAEFACVEKRTMFLFYVRCSKYSFANKGDETWKMFDNPFYRILV